LLEAHRNRPIDNTKTKTKMLETDLLKTQTKKRNV